MEKDRTGIVTMQKLIDMRAPYELLSDFLEYGAEKAKLSDFKSYIIYPEKLYQYWLNDHFAEPTPPKPRCKILRKYVIDEAEENIIELAKRSPRLIMDYAEELSENPDFQKAYKIASNKVYKEECDK